MKIPATLTTAILLPVLFAGTAIAQDTPSADQAASESRAVGWALSKIVGPAGRQSNLDQTRDAMRKIFLAADINGGGVSDADYLLRAQTHAARGRASTVSGILLLDIDGDGAVTREEIESQMGGRARAPIPADGVTLEPTPDQIRQRLETLVGTVLQHDRDGDSVIVFAEMLAAAGNMAPPVEPPPDSSRQIPSYLDKDGDGTVTMEEYSAVLEQAIAIIDEDGDGTLSPDEKAKGNELARQFISRETGERRAEEKARRQRELERKLIEGCAMPEVPGDARILLLAAYEGIALSTVSIGGDDEVVQVIDVHIEEGDRPLYVVVGSHHAVVWRLSGAVGRVAVFVADSQKRTRDGRARIGVVGLPKDRVHFTGMRDCVPRYEEGGRIKKSQREVMERVIGRPVDDTVVHYGIGQASLPGGAIKEKHTYPETVTPPKGTPGEPLWREMLHYNSGGLVRIEAESVVSPLPVGPYEVLPQEAGLAQLLDEGALGPYGKDRSELLETIENSPELSRHPTSFVLGRALLVIQRKIAFPAGLAGAHSVTFVLPPGVPEPDGNPGHSPVIRPSADP
ncbi:MAG: hypothetical protein OEZ03_00715 [Alphaproteobacteria bacterium]|nr:hypothetical protein [Alphaproteobacteria bacterium]